ncbi:MULTISPECIES: ribosome-binding factor A [unclassified Acinetobacter]|uniref:ribosome-binding factor A n=1 Tax=unclassified Acinetobacter TaxID=196816 RepID=UPI0035B8693E
MASQRLKRMADAVQREISELIRLELKDPRLGQHVTVSSVKVSPDLGYADVYVTVMGSELGDEQSEDAHQETLDILNKASGFMRQELGRRIKTRVTPRLRFHYDKTNAYGNYMFGLIAEAVRDLPEHQADQDNVVDQDDKSSS